MLALRTKRLISTGFVAALWIGVATFLGLYLLPAAQKALLLYREARQAENTLRFRMKEETPSAGLIRQYEHLKEEYKAEASACASFYFNDHNKKLDRPILKSYLMDTIQVANNYHEWKVKMAEKTGNPNFIKPYKWELPGGQPDIKDVPSIEKRTCIADVLVETLTAERGTVIQIIEIGEAMEQEQLVDIQPAPQVDWDVMRFRVYPTTVTFTARFVTLGRLLNLFVANPTDAAARPCMVVRSIKLDKIKLDKAENPDTVSVTLGVDIYDSYKVTRDKGT